MWSDLCLLFYFFLVHQTDYLLANNTAGCSSDPSCRKCGATGCIKCSNMIVYPSRKCVDSCPHGFTFKWSTKTGYMGQICEPIGTFLGLSNDVLTVLTGIVTGTLFCALIIASAVAYIKYRRKSTQHSVETSSDLDDTPERRDFIKQIEIIRPYAQTFLGMLNDTRRQLRELHQTGDNTAAAAYRPVVRDLAKILILLNKPKDQLVVPDDWEHLYNWAEKTLKRYKRMSEISQPQVAQLINFLQGPAVTPEPDQEFSPRASTTMSTFKPEQHFGSSLSLQDAAIKNFNVNYESTFTPNFTGSNFSTSNFPTNISSSKFASNVPSSNFASTFTPSNLSSPTSNLSSPTFSPPTLTGSTFTPALNPQWKFDYSLVSSGAPANSEFDPVVWKNSKEYLNGTSSFFMDDGFCQLGFRPQDEITTEL